MQKDISPVRAEKTHQVIDGVFQAAYIPQVYVQYAGCHVDIRNAPLFRNPLDAIQFAQNWLS